MAGIYLHIPFCRKACHYCDFHFSTSAKLMEPMIRSMHTELDKQRGYVSGEKISTIYFGGGTPSLLAADEIERFIGHIFSVMDIAADVEITLEANPDDLTRQTLQALRNTPVNRLSIGIQSFYDTDLTYMNRAHTAQQADYAVKAAQDLDFENITIDLIYGTPTLSDERWKDNLAKALMLDVPHISSYALTVEDQTPLFHLIQKKQAMPVHEERVSHQFDILMETLQDAGFEHYEISNFAKPGFRSRHNSNYWLGVPYLGIGPSAHSFDGKSRQWNVANNGRYIAALTEGKLLFEREQLTFENQVNEYIMIRLRLMEGLPLTEFEQRFGSDLRKQIEQKAYNMSSAWFVPSETHLILSARGKHMADKIAGDLFMELED